MPTAYDTRRRAYIFEGCFCGWSCVKGHNLEVNGGKYVHREICMHIARVMAQTKATECAAAPPRTALRMFGGTMELAVFRGGRTVSAAVVKPVTRGPAVSSRGGRTGSSSKRGRGPEGGHVRLDQLGFITKA